MKVAYKLFRIRKDGSIDPLFINKKQHLSIKEWLDAEDHPTKGYAHRPGWHCLEEMNAPHLSLKGRAWFVVLIDEYEELKRPGAQGCTWYIAKRMKILERSFPNYGKTTTESR